MTDVTYIGAVFLHGLPDPTQTDQFVALSPVISELKKILPPTNIICYKWGDEDNLQRAGTKALIGTLGADGCQKLDDYLTTKCFSRADIQRWIIGGYSAGGWIVNHWLFTAKHKAVLGDAVWDQKLQRIAAAFTIGSPFQNLGEQCVLRGRLVRTRPWTFYDYWRTFPEVGDIVQSWDLNVENLGPNVLAHSLQAGRYHTMWSLGDATILPANSRFPSWLVDLNLLHQRPLNTEFGSELDRFVGRGLTEKDIEALIEIGKREIHRDLCARPETITFMSTFLSALIKSLP